MAAKGNVLIIDDVPERALALEKLVSSEGFTTTTITEIIGAEVSLGIDSEFDVVLCELNLRGVS